MVAVREAGGRLTVDVPYDIDAFATGAAGAPLRWPVALGEASILNARLKRGIIALIRHHPMGETRDAIAIAAPALLSQGLTFAISWLFVERARAMGMRPIFSGPSIARTFAEGGQPNVEILMGRSARKLAEATEPRSTHILRRAAHGLLANKGFRWPWRAPATVLNHNHLLVAAARRDSINTFRFETLDRLFGGSPVAPSLAMSHAIDDAANEWATLVFGILSEIHGDVPRRFMETVREGARAWLEIAAGRANALARDWRVIPDRLWTGAGSNFFTRLARQRVRATGGEVVGFDHGGGMHIHADPAMFHISELTFADRFITETPAKADIYRASADESLLLDPRPGGTLPKIAAAPSGCGQFRLTRLGAARDVRRVMIVTTAFVGETQYPWVPLLPDPIYADWLARLIDGLADAGFEVLCKQHPEGVRKGRPLAVSPRATYLGGRFGDHLDKADAFIFDYPATTTLWEAMCTDRPVLFIDLGHTSWGRDVWRDFSSRCHIVQGNHDSWNRPQVDFDKLAQTLRTPRLVSNRFAERYLVTPRNEFHADANA